MSTVRNAARNTRIDRDWLWFAAWLVVGASWCLALLGALSIGVFVAPVALLLTVLLLLALRRGSAVGLPGLLSGPALLLCYVAYLNRGGPSSGGCTRTHQGTVCAGSATGSPSGAGAGTTTEQWDPMPWLAAGVVFLVAGVVLFLLIRRQARRDRARRSPAGSGPAGLRFSA